MPDAPAMTAREAARRLWPFIRPHWRGFAPAIFGMIAATLIGLIKPWPLKFLVDDVLGVGSGEPVDVAGDLILAISGAIVGIAVLQGLFNFLKEFFLSATSQRVAFGMRRALFSHLQRLSLGFHDRQRTGDTITRVTNDVTKVQELVADKLLIDGVSSVLQFVGMLTVMLVIDWRLGLVAVAWAPLVVLASSYYRRRIKAEELHVRAREGDMTSLAQETMSSIRVVKAFGREPFETRRFEEQTGEHLRASVDVLRLEARYSWIVTVLTAFGLAAMVFVGAHRVAAGALSAGTLIVFIQYMRDLQSPLNTLSRLWAKIAKVMVRAERIFEVLEQRPSVEDRPGAQPASRLRGEIILEHVTFGYDPGEPVLQDVTLTVSPGQTVAIVGATGAGKSTLSSLLLRLYDPDEGAVYFDGRDLRDYTIASVVDQISVVLQESLLFQATIRENIAYGAPAATFEEIRAAARTAYCDEFIMALPDGYDTVVGERGTTLSGGQRQRIAIARAVIRSAPILLLDEPTTGLDARSEEIVLRALERSSRGRTTILITHRASTLRMAEYIYVLDEGCVVEQGTHDKLLRAGGRYTEVIAGQPPVIAAET